MGRLEVMEKMQTSGVGSSQPVWLRRQTGFTLLELLLVVAIVALVAAGVSFALPNADHTALAREADRMVALLDAARARSQARGIPVYFRTSDNGFHFDGLPVGSMPAKWMSAEVRAAEPTQLVLGPDPIIGPQQLRLVSTQQGDLMLIVRTDGVQPFVVTPPVSAAKTVRER